MVCCVSSELRGSSASALLAGTRGVGWSRSGWWISRGGKVRYEPGKGRPRRTWSREWDGGGGMWVGSTVRRGGRCEMMW
mgnify:CR=1 FL=1